MDNKGFTLIELLASIVILAIIMALAIPSISSVSNAIRTSQRKNLIDKIEIAASKYAFDTQETSVFVETLIKEGYLESDNDNDEVIDPISNKKVNCYVVYMEKKNDYYVAKFQNERNYLGKNGSCDVVKYEEDGSIIIKSSETLKDDEWISTNDIIELSVDEDCDKNECLWTSNKGAYKLDSKIEINVADKLHEAKYTFHLRGIDSETDEIKEKTASINLKIDNKSPVIYDVVVDTNTNVATINASDRNGSGVKGYYINLFNNKGCTNPDNEYQLQNSFNLTENGKYLACVKDKVGNISGGRVFYIN